VTWFAWRQFRTQAIVATSVLVVLAVAFGVTGLHLYHVYDTAVKHCSSHGDCGSVISAFENSNLFLQHFIQAGGVLIAALIGAFWGAPLVAREFESGTFRLAWTQSVSRTRWLLSKLAVVALAAVVTEGLFTAMATWWAKPYDHLNNLPYSVFDTRDIVPVGYALFAVILGVVIGLLVRRTVPAMALTFATFAGVRILFTDYVRPHLASPLRYTTSFVAPFQSSSGGVPTAIVKPGPAGNAWILSDTTLNSSGKVIGANGGLGPNGEFNVRSIGEHRDAFVGLGTCPNKFPLPPSHLVGQHINIGPDPAMMKAMLTCINSFHLQSLFTYQPGSRFWLFQWYELGCYAVLSALLVSLSVWWVRRR
jgi:ABC-type transport system involved in multi-copper enzyme maturation permease subunit